MYSIVLKDGKTINFNNIDIIFVEKNRTLKLYYGTIQIGRINMDNIVGWVNANYKTKSEEQRKGEENYD